MAPGTGCHSAVGHGGTFESPDDLSDWMAGLPDDMPLAAVTMPGTHNSVSNAFVSGHMASVVSAARCQSQSLEGQLQMGVRFIDLRTRPDGTLCHGRIACVLTLQTALTTCSEFLATHASEVLIVRIKDEAGNKASSRAVDELFMSMIESAEHPFYLQRRLPKMREVRGRMVVLCDWLGGMWGLPWGGDAMSIQDEYWQSTGTKKWEVVRKHFRPVRAPDMLHISFTSATNLPRKVPLAMARSVNRKFAEFLLSSSRHRFLGIVAMDFPSSFLCRLLVQCNWTGLDPCRDVSYLTSSTAEAREWLDTVRCELQAAATRADVAVIQEPNELDARLQRVALVYTKLVVQRVEAEYFQRATEERAPVRHKVPDEEEPVRKARCDGKVKPVAVSCKRRGGQSSLGALGGCFFPQARRARERSSCVGPQAVESSTFVVEEMLDHLRCELCAAASNADAAEHAVSEQLATRVESLAQAYTRLLVMEAQGTLWETRPTAPHQGRGSSRSSQGLCHESAGPDDWPQELRDINEFLETDTLLSVPCRPDQR